MVPLNCSPPSALAPTLNWATVARRPEAAADMAGIGDRPSTVTFTAVLILVHATRRGGCEVDRRR
jgi:hypothetical protein